MESEREWYQQNVDRLLEPSLWVVSPEEGEDKEQTVTKKLGKVAKDFFKNRSEPTPASSAGKTSSEELLSEFIKLGEKNAWIDPDKIDRLHTLAESTGLIPPQEAEPDPGRHIPAFGRVIEEAYQRNHTLQKNSTSARNEPENVVTPPSDQVQQVATSPPERKEEIYRFLSLFGQWISDSITYPFSYVFRIKQPAQNELLAAFEAKDFDKARDLISKGVDVNHEDSTGRTALSYAAEVGALDLIKLLCHAKADINHTNKNGWTPLYYAAIYGHTEAVELLLKLGADINHTNNSGQTPLHYAAIYGQPEVVKLLLKLEADPTVKSTSGYNALEYAKSYRPPGLEEIVRLLEENSPEAVQSSKKKLKEDFLGHVAEIDIRSETRLFGDFSVVTVVRGQRTKCLGGFIQYNFVKIRKSLLEFSKEFPKVLTPGMSGMIRNTTASNCHSIQSPDELLQRWASGKPIVIHTGHAGHSVTVVVWKDKFIINNRGPGVAYDGPEAITMQVFTFDRSRFSAEIIKDIIHLLWTDLETYKKHLFEILPQKLGFTQSPVDKTIETARLPLQIISNCTFANAESAVMTIMILSKLFQLRPDLNQLNEQEIKEIIVDQKSALTNWEAYLLLRSIGKNLKWAKDPRNRFVPDFNLVKGSFARFASTHSLLPELKEKAAKLQKELDEVETQILSSHLGRISIFELIDVIKLSPEVSIVELIDATKLSPEDPSSKNQKL